MQGDRTTLHGGTFNLGIRKNFFIGRVVGQWNELPRVVESPSLAIYKRCGNMV